MTAPILNFVSGIATPAVNQLLHALAKRGDVSLRLWYSEETDTKLYPWANDPTHEVQRAEIYGKRWPSSRLCRAVWRDGEAFMIAGWSNPTMRLLIPMLTARHRRFAFFSDRPTSDRSSLAKTLMRDVYLAMLQHGSTVFGLGQVAIDYYADRGFPPDRLCNLPLPVELPEVIRAKMPARETVRARFASGPRDFLLVTGSRLVESKGFDLLLSAVAMLAPQERERMHLLIVGSGPEKDKLVALADQNGLGRAVHIEPWMEFVDFCGCIAAADLVVHPARSDPFGGITLTAVGAGVPVVGSRQSGSAIELINDGDNGFLYDAADIGTLANRIQRVMNDPKLQAAMARAARRVAANWTGERLAATLVNRLFLDGILNG